MKILKNRIFLSAVCIILASAISFILLPKFCEDKGVTATVLRAAQDIPAGTKIQEMHLASVEMGKFGLPDAVINDKTQIIGKIAQSDMSAGDSYRYGLNMYPYLFIIRRISVIIFLVILYKERV